MRRRRFVAAALIGTAAPGAITQARAQSDRHALVRSAAIAFGTTVELTALHDDAAHAKRALAAALQETQSVDRLMSLLRDDSEIARLNRVRVLEQPHPHVLNLLRHARTLSMRSAGAFDVTVQPLWLAHARAQTLARLPTQAEIEAARGHVDWTALEIDANQVRLAKPGMGVTLNGIAQGYAADLAIARLRADGITDALVDTGEFGASGRRDAHRPWSIGIAHPRAPESTIARVALDGRFVAVSGDYETTFTPDFEHHHIFEPRSGWSPTYWSSVAVAARTGLEADGLSTALMVLDLSRGRALLAKHPGSDALWIDKRVNITQTRGMRAAQD